MKWDVKQNSIRIIVKANTPRNQVVRYDDSREAYRVNIKEPAREGKANKEIIKFFSKLFKKDVKIVKGLKSKEKILKIR